jgi:RNA methyltransferase, TrmH family
MDTALTITSRANPRFKSLHSLVTLGGARRTHALMLGEKLIEAWVKVAKTPVGERFRPITWLRLEGVPPHPFEQLQALETLVLGEALMRDLAYAGSPPEHALLIELGPEPTGAFASRVIVPWGIQDPGNLGAILRSAASFGFQEALLGPGCADPFSPKALRGTMGAAFLLSIRRCERLVPDGGKWFALHGGEGSVCLDKADLKQPVRILVGNEGHGWKDVELPPEVQFLAIPIVGMESLNAAVAAGIACYEVDRRSR